MKSVVLILFSFYISSLHAGEILFSYKTKRVTNKRKILEKFLKPGVYNQKVLNHKSNKKCLKDDKVKANCSVLLVVPESQINIKAAQKYLVKANSREIIRREKKPYYIYLGGVTHNQSLTAIYSGEPSELDSAPYFGLTGEIGYPNEGKRLQGALKFDLFLNNSNYVSNEYIFGLGVDLSFDEKRKYSFGLDIGRRKLSVPVIQSQTAQKASIIDNGLGPSLNFSFHLTKKALFLLRLEAFIPLKTEISISGQEIVGEKISSFGGDIGMKYKNYILKSHYEVASSSGVLEVERSRYWFELGSYF